MSDSFEIQEENIYVNRLGKIVAIASRVKLTPKEDQSPGGPNLFLFSDFSDNLYYEDGRKFNPWGGSSADGQRPEDLIYKLDRAKLK